jgi:hypothetical protein
MTGREVMRGKFLFVRTRRCQQAQRLRAGALSSCIWTGTLCLAGILLAVALVTGCGGKAKEQTTGTTAEQAPESRVKRGTNGEVIITLDEKTQEVMGLKTTALAAAQLSPEAKGYGRVMDTSPLASLVAELAAARAAGVASQAELMRLKTLAAQNNASDRALQAAAATATREQAQAEAIRLRLLSSWGSSIAARDDLPKFVQTLSSLESALVEISLPAGESVKTMPTGARLATLVDESQPIAAKVIGPAPAVDPQAQGQGFLLLVAPNESHLAPGMAVTGLLSLPGEAQPGVTVPRDAIIRFNGTTWVYLQTGGQTFQRVEVALERPLENGWFVRGHVKPDDKVVTVAAQQLLSEELKGAAEND